MVNPKGKANPGQRGGALIRGQGAIPTCPSRFALPEPARAPFPEFKRAEAPPIGRISVSESTPTRHDNRQVALSQNGEYCSHGEAGPQRFALVPNANANLQGESAPPAFSGRSARSSTAKRAALISSAPLARPKKVVYCHIAAAALEMGPAAHASLSRLPRRELYRGAKPAPLPFQASEGC